MHDFADDMQDITETVKETKKRILDRAVLL